VCDSPKPRDDHDHLIAKTLLKSTRMHHGVLQ